MRKNQTASNNKRQPQEQPCPRFTMRTAYDRHTNNSVPMLGEPVYCPDSREFLIGDGRTPISMLDSVNNVVVASDGRPYTVSIDSRGNVVQVLPFRQPIVMDGFSAFLEFNAQVFPPLSLN